MNDSIKLARRQALRQFAIRFGFFTRIKVISGAKSVDLDAVVDASLTAGLEDASQLGDYKILGCMINPLMQNQA